MRRGQRAQHRVTIHSKESTMSKGNKETKKPKKAPVAPPPPGSAVPAALAVAPAKPKRR